MKLSNDDWAMLFPGRTVKLGNQILEILPLNISNISRIIKRLNCLKNEFASVGITIENYMDKIADVADVIVSYAPEILSVSTGLDQDDIKRLPAAKILEIVSCIIDVNIESQDGLIKNFQSLVGKITALAGDTAKSSNS